MSSHSRLGLPMTLQAERTITAYLGFGNIIDLQRFVIMWPCLEAMWLLSALPDLTSESFVFMRTTEGTQVLQCNHPVSLVSEYIQNCWMACVLIVLRHNVGVYSTNTFQQNRTRTIAAASSVPSRFWIPDHIMEEEELPPYPILRPTIRFNEPDMIPLHRCLCLLQYLELSHGSEPRRERYLEARAHCSGEEFEVTEHDIPWWMRLST
ncbi:hypothetical protein N7491_006264 [Penicillium cf. griseofulvum]|uniref:Uncharacterized protein n=1 Tax=Penicillium cf. griseofulvum TaxID=2972120 RepID=A0A9W9IXB7_9EURO|nr:hypothetical protein N7472_010707 [Penicillium cf. griseofulvum]KAJ5429248.1 hypothetical protein N7491_006264 [Penicillium cf. griseofulvum]KAJ5436961.1 hypothetical protein N7445_007846 [Penicillium cf. griseofulvum]